MPELIIDAHVHCWIYDPKRDGWITDEMKMIQRDFLPPDLEKEFRKNQVQGSILVQADGSEKENHFLMDLAEKNPFIEGVVGWISLRAPDLEQRLEYYRQFAVMKGFRELLQGEKKRDSMLDPVFQKGIALLEPYGFSFDLLVLPDQLRFAEKLVAAFPGQRFVIDHLAKPPIREGKISAWQDDMKRFAGFENVYCKISGMVTEADWKNWEQKDFKPYMDIVLETFGTKRIMFGSDWPVCLNAGKYEEIVGVCADYFEAFSPDEQDDFFGRNAMDFYKLN